jgi:predicted metalloprotease
MRLEGHRQSSNVEDRRGMRRGPVMLGGGIGTLVIVGLVMLLGGDPRALFNQMQQGAPEEARPLDPREEELGVFVKRVLATTEDAWQAEFRRNNRNYEPAQLVLFTGQVESACGIAGAAVGPFYCPADRKVYIDLTFYDELRQKFGAPGDFAQAYVIAHEVGHHVQNLLGTSDRVQSERGRISQTQYNQLSVRLELQADFYAGVWAHHNQEKLEEGDIEEGIVAAEAIGDDRLQRQAQGRVVPDSFTHGTSQQRVRWFMKGYRSGRMEDGDTFDVPYDQL